MNPEVRLAEILDALEAVGLSCLVLGGHAVRYYGLSRTTNDFDLHLAPEGWPDLAARLARCPLFATEPPVEGPSWRPNDFRRFQIGLLADGREEWLEFWRHNHLLPPFAELFARREVGEYGGRLTSFFSLPDLIRSKETEREADWLDVTKLEEILDARLLSGVKSGAVDLVAALARVRSRSGLEGYLDAGHLKDPAVVELALTRASTPMTIACLLPSAPEAARRLALTGIEPAVSGRLRTTTPGSPLHLSLVEIVRRRYKLDRQAADKADKQSIRASQAGGSSPG